MIVARLYETKNVLVPGSCGIKGYTDGGWFPVDSFGFGFDPKLPTEESDNTTGSGNTGGQTNSGNAGGRPPARRTASASATVTEEEKDFTQIALSKQVDTGSCELMHLAMRDRLKKKGVESKIQADIHVLGIVTVDGNRHIYPSLMIHLEGVLVKEWSLEAGGDDRPSESLTLWYDRAAMRYLATPDGKEFKPSAPRGWNQTKNEDFTWDEGKWNEYLKDLPKPGKFGAK